MGNKIVAVLSGGLVKDATTGRWRTSGPGDEGDKFGATFDRFRVLAAAYLYRENPEIKIIVSGGRGQQVEEDVTMPTLASVLKEELIALGVPAASIEEESSSFNTHQQLLFIIREVELNHRPPVELSILSNGYHLPRILAMLRYAPGLRSIPHVTSAIKLVSAEEILKTYDPEKWLAVLQAAEESPAMVARIALEQRGVEMIRNGEYRYKL